MIRESRRSWLQGVGKLFGGNKEEGYFLGLQLLIHAFGEDTLRARLAEVIADPDGALEDREAKRRYLKRIVALLLEQQAYWSQAFWEYKVTEEEAAAEFEAWAAEISASTATEGEELEAAVDGAYRSSTQKDYVAVTIILHLSVPFPPAAIEDESLYWRTQIIEKIVRGLLLINPDTILADGVFVIPGNSTDGLSEQDLLTGGWSYLRVLT